MEAGRSLVYVEDALRDLHDAVHHVKLPNRKLHVVIDHLVDLLEYLFNCASFSEDDLTGFDAREIRVRLTDILALLDRWGK